MCRGMSILGIRRHDMPIDGQSPLKDSLPVGFCKKVFPLLFQHGGEAGREFQLRLESFLECFSKVFFVLLKWFVSMTESRKGDFAKQIRGYASKDFTDSGKICGNKPATTGKGFKQNQRHAFKKGGQDKDGGTAHQLRKSRLRNIPVQGNCAISASLVYLSGKRLA